MKSVARFVQVCCVNVQKVFYTGCFYTGCFTWGVLYRVFLYRMFYMGCLYSVLYRVFYMECFTWGVLYRVFYTGCLYGVFLQAGRRDGIVTAWRPMTTPPLQRSVSRQRKSTPYAWLCSRCLHAKFQMPFLKVPLLLPIKLKVKANIFTVAVLFFYILLPPTPSTKKKYLKIIIFLEIRVRA